MESPRLLTVQDTHCEILCIGRFSCLASTASGVSLRPVTMEPPRSAAPDRPSPCHQER